MTDAVQQDDTLRRDNDCCNCSDKARWYMDGIVKELIFILVFCAGILATLFIFHHEIRLGHKADNLIKKCEIELPRNQNCIVKAEPDNE